MVCLITPWNEPLITPSRKSAPALISGNAVVLKPASETPIVALHLARALHDAGLPAGVLDLAGRAGSRTRCWTIRGWPRSPSPAAPRSAARCSAAGRARRAAADGDGRQERHRVLDDADLALAVPTLAAAVFGQAGQRCTATSRVVVDRPSPTR